jgi:hypothetical protein
MHSAALFPKPGRHAVEDCGQAQSSVVAEKPVERTGDGETHLALVGELRVRGSLFPVYAVASQRSKHKSALRRIVFQIWWRFGRRFWPCAELDNEW